MVGYRLVALSLRGETVLKRQLEEWKKQPFPARMTFNNFFRREIEKEKPFSIAIYFKPQVMALVRIEDVFNSTRMDLKAEGLVEKVDYVLEAI